MLAFVLAALAWRTSEIVISYRLFSQLIAQPLRAAWPLTLWSRLLVLLLAATGPLLGLLLLEAVNDGRVVLDGGREQVMQLARLGAEQQDDVFQEAANLLFVLSRVDSVRELDSTRCDDLLRDVVADHPRIEALAVANSDGLVTCGSRTNGLALSIGGRNYFTDAMRLHGSERYALSSLTISRVSGKPTLFVTVPMPPLATGDTRAGVLVAALDLEWFSRLRGRVPDVADQLYLVIDSRDGALLARSPDLAMRVGKRFPEHPLMAALLASPQGGTTVALDLDGVSRVFGFVPLPGRENGLFLAIGLSEAGLRAQADARFWWATAIAVGTTGFAIVTAWLVAQRAMLQPIRALAAAAASVGKGDLSARATIEKGAALELRNLGATFTRMARRLRDRDMELAGMQGQLAASEEHHRLLADASNDMITRFDCNFRRTYVSQASSDVLGYAPDELIGHQPGGIVHPDDWEALNKTLNLPLMAGQATARASYRARRKDGHFVWLESSGRRLPDGSGFVVVTRDVSARKVLEARLEDANRQLRILVRQDGLTGVANRRRFDEALGDEYRRAFRSGHSLALIMFDVDRFKAFNDRYGHPAGDRCLQALAGVFGSVLRRSGDLAARYGGEEFAILMAETDLNGALSTAERLRAAVRKLGIPHENSEGKVVTISVGVAAMHPGPNRPGPAALVEAADAALYAAKAGGRDRVCVADNRTTQLS